MFVLNSVPRPPVILFIASHKSLLKWGGHTDCSGLLCQVHRGGEGAQ